LLSYGFTGGLRSSLRLINIYFIKFYKIRSRLETKKRKEKREMLLILFFVVVVVVFSIFVSLLNLLIGEREIGDGCCGWWWRVEVGEF
jgi:ABC-type lipoprotein release transport system permease subunit